MTEDKVEKLLKSGNKLAAIQVLVKEEGFSLKDAKDYVDQYQLEYGMEQAAINQHNAQSETQEASWFFIFGIDALVFLIIVSVTAPLICQDTKVLQGFFGVCFWLFTHGISILFMAIVSCNLLWKLLKAQHKAKELGSFLLSLVFLFIFIAMNGSGAEAVGAAKDLVSEPIEVSFANYEVEAVYMSMGRYGGDAKVCFRVIPENYQGINSIIMPRKSLKNILSKTSFLYEPDLKAMRKEQGAITILVYPNTGIVANRKSLETLSEKIIID